MKQRFIGPVKISITGKDGQEHEIDGTILSEDFFMDQPDTIFSDASGNEYVMPGVGSQGYWRTINLVSPPPDFNNGKPIHFTNWLKGAVSEQVGEQATPQQSEQDDLLAERGKEYADAWILTTEVVGYLMEHGHFNVLGRLVGKDAPYLYSWITILCKLLRALASPRKADHWRDMAGYAILVAEHIETGSRGR